MFVFIQACMLPSTRTAMHSGIMASWLVSLFALDLPRRPVAFVVWSRGEVFVLATRTRFEWQVKGRRVGDFLYRTTLHRIGLKPLLQGIYDSLFINITIGVINPATFCLCRYNPCRRRMQRFLRMGAWNGTTKEDSGWFYRNSDVELDLTRVVPVKSCGVLFERIDWHDKWKAERCLWID